MTDAYKCDKCGEYEPGSGETLSLRKEQKSELIDLSKGKLLTTGEFCESCEKEVIALVKEAMV